MVMKKIKLTVIMTITDELYESNQVQELKNDILSGKFQRDINESWNEKIENGVIACKATMETIK